MFIVSNLSNLAMEEEKQNSESQYGGSSNSLNSKDLNKRERRLMQNRKSASKLRVKKKHNMKHLMTEKDELKSTNDLLRSKVNPYLFPLKIWLMLILTSYLTLISNLIFRLRKHRISFLKQ